MELNLMSIEAVYPNINIVFDDSIYAVDDDTSFVCSVGQRFNANITFPSYATAVRIGGTPYNFNYPVSIPNNVINMNNALAGCSNFNQPVSIPNSVRNCIQMFRQCVNFNQPVSMPYSDGPVDYSSMFQNCYNFNQPVIFNDGHNSNMFYTFSYCNNFNSVVTFGNNVQILYATFLSCANFNQPVTIPDSVVNMYQCFSSCQNFNQPVNLNNKVSNIQYLFQSCYRYNQTFNIPTNASSCYMLFSGDYCLDQPIVIPNSVTQCQYMFQECRAFNQPITIPNSVTSTSYMFSNCTSVKFNADNGGWYPQTYEALRKPIYFYANNIAIDGAQFMFMNCNTMTDLYVYGLQNNRQLNYFIRYNNINMCNIYTDDAGKDILYNTYLLTNRGKPTWTNDDTNGCIYNELVNIYIYNNWDGVIS